MLALQGQERAEPFQFRLLRGELGLLVLLQDRQAFLLELTAQGELLGLGAGTQRGQAVHQLLGREFGVGLGIQFGDQALGIELGRLGLLAETLGCELDLELVELRLGRLQLPFGIERRLLDLGVAQLHQDGVRLDLRAGQNPDALDAARASWRESSESPPAPACRCRALAGASPRASRCPARLAPGPPSAPLA